ncbi:MAG: serine/threonine protein kinase [Myxococcales bacterium]|nr:serine/threonine protein kinase [Myxococcales bacterium]
MSLVGKKIGNYNITRQIGEGGMGAVYLGEHPLIGKKVAVKVLHDDLAGKQDIVQRFFTEAKAVNDIHHENIVDIVDFGQIKDENNKDLVYFLMELLEGEGVSARLKREPLTHAEAVHIIAQCASALQASHTNNIVHRDIKPDNIFLIKRGQDACFVKLLDFGIAKLTGAGASSGMTRTGSVIGTPAYMSPEQCDGKGNIDSRSDVYSLGVVMYEMLCGRVPFPGEGFGEILVAHLTTVPPRPSTLIPGMPQGLDDIVMRCLEKDRTLRFQSMEELRQAVMSSESYVAPRSPTGANAILSASVTPTNTGQGPRPTTLSGAAGQVGGTGAGPAPRSRTPIFAGLGLLAVGGAVAAFLATSKPDPPSVATHAIPGQIAPGATAKIEIVQILIDSTPQGAVITRAGHVQPIGRTPFELKLTRGAPAFDVLLTLDAFRPESRTITTNDDRDLLVVLGKKADPSPAAAATQSARPPAAKAKGGATALPRLPSDDGEMRLIPDKPARKEEKSADPDGVLAPKL